MIYDVVIVGGGVVGLSILRCSILAGYNAILFERNPHLCDGASGRNSGVLCTGVDAASGSLERALIRDSVSRVREFCTEHNVPMRECGSLVCLWPWDESEIEGDRENFTIEEKKIDDNLENSKSLNHKTKIMSGPCLNEEIIGIDEKLRDILHDSHIAGDNDAMYLNAKSVSMLEPSLSSACKGAVHIPGEIVVDPWLFPISLAAHSRELAKSLEMNNDFEDVIQTGREVVLELSSFDKEKNLWTIVTHSTTDEKSGDNPITITARSIVNAAGVDSDIVQLSASSSSKNGSLDNSNRCAPPPPNFEARPRRGQYLVYSAPQSDTENEMQCSNWGKFPKGLPIRPIQPCPTERTKGIFVYSTLYNQIVVGPTAKDQTSRSDDSLDPNVAKELASHASKVFGRQMGSSASEFSPDFDRDIVGEYVGIRPGTSKRDYQIQMHYPAKFITVGGIRSTGLTASLGIGRHVVQSLLSAMVEPSQMSLNSKLSLHPTPLPSIKNMVDQYHSNGDGTIVINEHRYKVTHPLTRMGWDARTGLAA